MTERYLVEIVDSCRYNRSRWEVVLADFPPVAGFSWNYNCWTPATRSGISTCDDCHVEQTKKIAKVEPYTPERAKEHNVDACERTLQELIAFMMPTTLDAFAHLADLGEPHRPDCACGKCKGH